MPLCWSLSHIVRQNTENQHEGYYSERLQVNDRLPVLAPPRQSFQQNIQLFPHLVTSVVTSYLIRTLVSEVEAKPRGFEWNRQRERGKVLISCSMRLKYEIC